METKTVFVLGAPASGKSTFIRFFSLAAKRKGRSAFAIYDGELLRQLCPKINIGRGRGYFYRGDSLILEDDSRQRILNLVFKEVASALLRNQNSYNYCLVEFTHPDWKMVLSNYFGEVFRLCPVLVFLTIGGRDSLRRNKLRKESSVVPDSYIRLFKGEDEKTDRWFRKKFDHFFRVDNQGKKRNLYTVAADILGQLEG
ncbi:hypothetical protein KKD61_05400 [Patescibacteria group bacterium]|nr:hypothetical protein [Patescibacteria group bacterium]